ncbi:Secondary metabolism regulator LAE1 [Colletotrichum sp. SAR11_240]|nr:Secondary metabolism regulator LAE1 [Colletotrichum sp. SAR11_240]
MAPSIKDWPKLLSQAYRALKPGAWLEIQDIVPECKCDDGTMPPGQQYAPAKMMDLIKDGIAQFGVDLRAGKSHEGRIKAAGFQNLVHDTKKVPVGTWPKDSRLRSIGSYARAVIYDGLHANSAHAFFNDKLQQILDCFPASAPARPLEKLTPIEDDHIMELICLFNDARDVRNFLKRTWTRPPSNT